MMPRLLLVALLSAMVLPLRAWDPLGHQIVGQIAADNLTPAARAGVQAAIDRFNAKDQPDAPYTIAIAGCWMDDVRSRTKDFNPWHYITMPFSPGGEPMPVGSAAEPNVVWGMQHTLAILRGETEDPAIDKDQAMVMLMHLVGDAHQPLHTLSRNDDLGGNRVKVGNLKDPQVDLIFSRGGNLHFFWDSAYRRVYKGGYANVLFEAPLYDRNKPVTGHRAASEIAQREAANLQKKFPASRYANVGDPVSWAKESYRLGYDYAYGKLPPGGDTEPLRLPQTYVEAARPIGEERIALAGYRLAYLLNQLYGAPAADAAASPAPTATPAP